MPQTNRRAFIRNGALILTAAACSETQAWSAVERSQLRIGLVTDLHYADKPPAGSRHYRETLAKLDEAASEFAEEPLDFIVELGDFIDAADSVQDELRYLDTINRKFAKICDQRHYVLGNHCVDTLTKQEFLGAVGKEQSYYSFDSGGLHFVVLDSCFRSDGEPYGRRNSKWTDTNIPESELTWLEKDLHSTTNKTIVFAHQRLDVNNHYGVKNAAAVRSVLEQSSKVLSVLQGHSHKNDLNEINGIHYCTLVAMVEGRRTDSNGFSVMDVTSDGSIRISGFRNQKSYDWPIK